MRLSTIKLLIPAAVLGLLGAACGGKALGSETAGKTISAARGHNVSVVPPGKRHLTPSYKGESLDGAVVRSTGLRGKWLVVNFWASWCAPCRQEQATLEKVWESHKDRAVAFLGIDVRDRKADAMAHVSEFGVTYPSIFNFDASIANVFRVIGIPQTFILDPQGRVAVKIFGATPQEDELSKLLDTELARSPAPAP